jgi:hypothetical protein
LRTIEEISGERGIAGATRHGKSWLNPLSVQADCLSATETDQFLHFRRNPLNLARLYNGGAIAKMISRSRGS